MKCAIRFSHVACLFTALSILSCGKNSTGNDGPKPLEVGIQFPPNNAVVQNSVTITGGVSGGSGGTIITFLIDGSVVLVDSSAPYQCFWNPNSYANGSAHTLRTVGRDSEGHIDSSATKTVYAKWRLLGSGAGIASDFNIRGVYARSSDLSVEFRVEFDRDWSVYDSDAGGIDCSLFLDVDRNANSGIKLFSSGGSSHSIGDIGADYRICIGIHGDSLWNSGSGWLGGKAPRVVRVTNPSRVIEFSVQHGDIGGPAAFDLVVLNVRQHSAGDDLLDWVPSSGHLSYTVDMLYFGPALALSTP